LKAVCFVDKLIDMGAKIMLCDPHRAVVMGQLSVSIKSDYNVITRHSCGYLSIDCSTFGKGTSTIQNIEQIDRGYERIDERLRAIGAKIVRVE
jgi:UDP-N-acetylglucosamine 1-carboxyvinyltransferase